MYFSPSVKPNRTDLDFETCWSFSCRAEVALFVKKYQIWNFLVCLLCGKGKRFRKFLNYSYWRNWVVMKIWTLLVDWIKALNALLCIWQCFHLSAHGLNIYSRSTFLYSSSLSVTSVTLTNCPMVWWFHPLTICYFWSYIILANCTIFFSGCAFYCIYKFHHNLWFSTRFQGRPDFFLRYHHYRCTAAGRVINAAIMDTLA